MTKAEKFQQKQIIKNLKEKLKKLDKEIANYEKNGMKPKTPKLSDYKAGLNNNEGE